MKDTFGTMSPQGYYVAIRVGFSFPESELNNLPALWVDFYTAHGLVIYDPAMKWVYGNSGSTRFSAITAEDPQKVFLQAAVFGLVYGAATSVSNPEDRGLRSYGFFFRDDREFTDQELLQLEAEIRQLHAKNAEAPQLTHAEIQALQLQSEGLRLKQVADRLEISESAVKARLNNVKRKLGAKTLSQASSIAALRGYHVQRM